MFNNWFRVYINNFKNLKIGFEIYLCFLYFLDLKLFGINKYII